AVKHTSNHTTISTALFEYDEEQALYEAANEVAPQLEEAIHHQRPEEAYEALSSLEDKIHHYFEHVMVMSEDTEKKQNRLNQMKTLARMIRSFADFQAIVL